MDKKLMDDFSAWMVSRGRSSSTVYTYLMALQRLEKDPQGSQSLSSRGVEASAKEALALYLSTLRDGESAALSVNPNLALVGGKATSSTSRPPRWVLHAAYWLGVGIAADANNSRRLILLTIATNLYKRAEVFGTKWDARKTSWLALAKLSWPESVAQLKLGQAIWNWAQTKPEWMGTQAPNAAISVVPGSSGFYPLVDSGSRYWGVPLQRLYHYAGFTPDEIAVDPTLPLLPRAPRSREAFTPKELKEMLAAEQRERPFELKEHFTEIEHLWPIERRYVFMAALGCFIDELNSLMIDPVMPDKVDARVSQKDRPVWDREWAKSQYDSRNFSYWPTPVDPDAPFADPPKIARPSP